MFTQEISELMGLLEEAANTRKNDNGMRDYIIVRLMYQAGLRVSELTGLDVKHIVFENDDTVLVEIEKSKNKKHGRVVSVCDPKLFELLFLWNRGIEGDVPMFVSNKGNKMSVRAIQRVCKKWLGKVVCDELAHAHTLRHSFGAESVKCGVKLPFIKTQMGHSSITSTQVYTEMTEEESKMAYRNVRLVKE